MTAEDGKRCLFSECKVVYNGATYDKINAITYRLDESKKNILVSAELLDKNRYTIVMARLSEISEVVKI